MVEGSSVELALDTTAPISLGTRALDRITPPLASYFVPRASGVSDDGSGELPSAFLAEGADNPEGRYNLRSTTVATGSISGRVAISGAGTGLCEEFLFH